jgi:hypothetical protein
MAQAMDTNSLVEEFMLLANVTTAKQTYTSFPECALLRRHPTPPGANFEPLILAVGYSCGFLSRFLLLVVELCDASQLCCYFLPFGK